MDAEGSLRRVTSKPRGLQCSAGTLVGTQTSGEIDLGWSSGSHGHCGQEEEEEGKKGIAGKMKRILVILVFFIFGTCVCEAPATMTTTTTTATTTPGTGARPASLVWPRERDFVTVMQGGDLQTMVSISMAEGFSVPESGYISISLGNEENKEIYMCPGMAESIALCPNQVR